jgi:hypothetical protein
MRTWIKDGAGWRCEMPGDVTLFAVPIHTKGLFGDKPARGTKWRAGATHWDAATSTASRYGRDVYREECADHKAAKALATRVWEEVQ